ncbi:MAG TPA: enoyl-CoA hydratase-related protein [Micropepsaceae bacterium]|nr:enoyl-CoA hydratase-related protein [Micropepsaceae bacterium]
MDIKINTPRAGRPASQTAPSKNSQPQTAIGFIGLGHMGKPMAANLAAAGHSVTACVRHADEVQGLAPPLRAAVLFGHGENFSRGVDVDAFTALAKTGKLTGVGEGEIDPLGKSSRLTKPLVVVVHGDTWNLGHELHLVADIRIASADVRFGQDENTHGRFPGGGATIRFVREAGWGNAIRYMLTGDHWGAEEALRMGIVQAIAPDPPSALEAGVAIAQKIAACGPLGIRLTLDSAHLAIDQGDQVAFSRLDEQYGSLYHTEDFIEGRRAEAEGRPPVYRGH